MRRLSEQSELSRSWMGGSAPIGARARKSAICETSALHHPPSPPSPARGLGHAHIFGSASRNSDLTDKRSLNRLLTCASIETTIPRGFVCVSPPQPAPEMCALCASPSARGEGDFCWGRGILEGGSKKRAPPFDDALALPPENSLEPPKPRQAPIPCPAVSRQGIRAGPVPPEPVRGAPLWSLVIGTVRRDQNFDAAILLIALGIGGPFGLAHRLD